MVRFFGFLLVVVSLCGCGPGRSSPSPTSPTSVEVGGLAFANLAADRPPVFGPDGPHVGTGMSAGPAVIFPPRNEPFSFRQELETVYRDRLGRTPSPTYVDLEGSIVWTQEYLRYRLSACSHADTVTKVLSQIEGRGIAPECGGNAPFPPRNEPFDFRTSQLETTYRDGLRRPVQQLYVDPEGDVVWTQEYLRYRIGNCSHSEATALVLSQVLGGPVQPTCGPLVVGGAHADFMVAPETGTNVNPGQCAVTQTPGPRNLLRCTFDARSSTPRPGISSYEWSVPGQDSLTTVSGELIQGMTLPCGTFPGGNTTDKMITLTVRTPGSSNSVSKVVTFVKQGTC